MLCFSFFFDVNLLLFPCTFIFLLLLFFRIIPLFFLTLVCSVFSIFFVLDISIFFSVNNFSMSSFSIFPFFFVFLIPLSTHCRQLPSPYKLVFRIYSSFPLIFMSPPFFLKTLD